MASRLLESMEDVRWEVEHLGTVEGQGGGTAEARSGGAGAGIGGLSQAASSVEDILNEWDDLLSPGPGSGVWTQEQSGASPEQAMALAEGGVATLMGASRRVAGLLGGVDGMGGTDEDDGGDVGRSAGGDDTRRAPQSPGAHPGSDDHLQQVARQHTASHQLPCPSGEVAGRAGTNSEQLSGRRRPGGELSATGRAWDTQATVGMGPQVETVRRDSYSASVERIAQVRGHLARQSAQGLQSRGVGAGGRGLQRKSMADAQVWMRATQFIILSPLGQRLGILAVAWVGKLSWDQAVGDSGVMWGVGLVVEGWLDWRRSRKDKHTYTHTAVTAQVWSALVKFATTSQGNQRKGSSHGELVLEVEGYRRKSMADAQVWMGAIQFIILSPLGQRLGILAVAWVGKLSWDQAVEGGGVMWGVGLVVEGWLDWRSAGGRDEPASGTRRQCAGGADAEGLGWLSEA
ncbi:hypothetical protein CYMTET_51315 [Cymbomonas tetramitiformis]|uniref:Uncharacterized protein n=1 Tax=Cymbomonas tetramitiformis TaxID=36881 RepID=A0AAE0ESR6_9CHLO|nr:hypothetical protein CYMTET_51315 [Cymbomonas tetramitiformis]